MHKPQIVTDFGRAAVVIWRNEEGLGLRIVLHYDPDPSYFDDMVGRMYVERLAWRDPRDALLEYQSTDRVGTEPTSLARVETLLNLL